MLRELQHPTQLTTGEKYRRLLITQRTDLIGTLKWEGTVGYLRQFHDRLVENDPLAGSLLYQVWPEIDKNDPMAWLSYLRGELFVWECVAAKVKQTLTDDRRAGHGIRFPAGRWPPRPSALRVPDARGERAVSRLLPLHWEARRRPAMFLLGDLG